MFRILYLFALVLAIYQTSAQNGKVEIMGNANFGNVKLGNTDTLHLKIRHTFSSELQIKIALGIKSNSLFLLDTSFTLATNIPKDIQLVYKPVSNIMEKNYLWVSSAKFGTKSIDINGQGVFEDAYYESTRNKFEESLKTALSLLISNAYKNMGYNYARDLMYGNIDNENGQVIDVYTGREASFSTRSGANANSFNTEHTWPQSKFNSKEPEKADMHHLFPCDVSANSRRANYSFGEVTNAEMWNAGGSKLGSNQQNQTVFEVRDQHKGAAARAMFYFALRYENYTNFLDDQEKVLRKWSSSFLPSKKELDRNDAIYNYQKNRNPFVDHPYFLNRIRSLSTFSEALNNPQHRVSIQSIIGPIVDENGAFERYPIAISYDNDQAINVNVEVKSRAQQKNRSVFAKIDNAVKDLSPKNSHTFELSASKNLSFKDTLDVYVNGKMMENLSVLLSLDFVKIGQIIDKKAINYTTFPNPFHDSFFISCAAKFTQLKLTDPSGRIVYFGGLKKGLNEINGAHLSTGHYFGVLISKDIKTYFKLHKR